MKDIPSRLHLKGYNMALNAKISIVYARSSCYIYTTRIIYMYHVTGNLGYCMNVII